ncbi:MAG: HypC/HybG/HupF family hydrogenase formation chaperone [Dehalococcoidia bacterium]|jgi:hydrogenase expression/formation protein HypC|nr:MAG: HypC/HybG/HupF family hydrogenase formation chaperone [Dehalococcoidia bacterium]
MCLAIPARVTQIDQGLGLVEVGGVVREASFMLLPDAQVGDYVLLHAGYALQKVDEAEAEETIRLLAELAEAGRAEA